MTAAGASSAVDRGARALFEDAFPGLSWDDSDPAERPVWLRTAKIVLDAARQDGWAEDSTRTADFWLRVSSTLPPRGA